MDVVAHDAIEKVKIEYFVLFIGLKYKSPSLCSGSIDLYHNLLQSLMKIAKDLL